MPSPAARGGVFASVAVPADAGEEVLGVIELYANSPAGVPSAPVRALDTAGQALGALL
jgi:hypothetical protein